MTGTVCDATTSGVSSWSRRREWVAAAANASARRAEQQAAAASEIVTSAARAKSSGSAASSPARPTAAVRHRADVQGAHHQRRAERERDEQPERRGNGRPARRWRGGRPDRRATTRRPAPSALVTAAACLPPGHPNDKARADTPSGPGPPSSRPQHAPPPSRSPRGTRRHTLWRQVFWLPDRPPAAPSRQRAGSGFSQPSSPVTAAGPRRSCTGFPQVALAGTSKRRGC